ncbi:MAG: EamA family transporter [Peptostreptococcaceae bacterium]|nr:EamA family transporter [Peptostreptococcaceae bacterium]
MLKKKDFFLLLLVVFVWGTTFTVIKLGISGMPSLVLVAGRYLLTAFPAVFFVKKPTVQTKYILLYGFVSGVLQLSVQFYAMERGMPAAVTSVLLQSAAFFTAFFAFAFFRESISANKILGFLIAAAGLLLIALSKAEGLAYIPPSGLLLTLLSAVFWGLSNIIIKYASLDAQKKGASFDSFSFLIRSSLIPPIPLIGISFLLYPKESVLGSIFSMNLLSFASMLYLALFGTLLGYGSWNHLLAKYPASKIAPFSLLVPISGFFFAFAILGERLTLFQGLGSAVILLGLFIANRPSKRS